MTMKAKDVMTTQVLTVAPEASVMEALQLMLEHRISGLPVVDAKGDLVGIVTEGDFLRRAETGTERRRSRFLEFLVGPGALASDYVRSHGRRVDEVMTKVVLTVGEDAELADIVAVMEKHRVKRLPVMSGEQLVGIVSRANLLHALAAIAGEIRPGQQSDEAIRDRVIAELDRQTWAPRHLIDVIVRNGAVELWGSVFDSRQRDAARVAAETVPGVKSAKSHLIWLEPMSGMAFRDPEDDIGEDADGAAQPEDKKKAANG
jgi:CBS domain-containing protein